MLKPHKKSKFARYPLGIQRRIKSLFLNKKAVSVVVSTIVVTAGVLGMGIGVLFWAYSMGDIAAHTYSNTEATNAKAVQERLAFEFTDYSTSNNILTVNVMNWGDSGNLTIANVYIYNSSHQYVGNFSRPALRNIVTSALIPFGLSVTGEGYFQIRPNPALAAGSFYYIRIITDRGRTFDGSFATP
jgi:hypothetical protein